MILASNATLHLTSVEEKAKPGKETQSQDAGRRRRAALSPQYDPGPIPGPDA